MALPQGTPRHVLRLVCCAALLLPSISPAQTGLLTCSPCALHFSRVQAGQTKTLSATLSNSGTKTIVISGMNDNAPRFEATNITLPLTLGAGKSVEVAFVFAPTDNGRAWGNIDFISNATNRTLTIELYGLGVGDLSLIASPWGLDFGGVQVNTSKTLNETLKNTSRSTVTISQATITGAGFSMTGLQTPLALTAGQSFTFSVALAPKAAGAVTGNLTILSNASNPTLTIPLSGTGIAAGQLTVSPATLNFGNVTVGSSKSLNGSLSAGGATVTVSSATASSSEFVIGGLSFPVRIDAGKSASYTVTFTPQSSGSASATATFSSDAANSPTTQSLKGVGVPAPGHSVGLSWEPSSDPVQGYNVYRGSKTGGPYTKVNSGLEPGTAYTDTTVKGGQTYFYVATAVDQDDLESKPSNEVKAVIPSP